MNVNLRKLPAAKEPVLELLVAGLRPDERLLISNVRCFYFFLMMSVF